MSASISLTQTQIFTATVAVLNSFGLIDATGSPIPVIRGQVNRVPEPSGSDFAVVWPISRGRLAMNVDTTTDTAITGSIANNVLTVTVVTNGPILAGAALYGANVTAGCQIVEQLTGPAGGIGTYSTTPAAPLSSQIMWCGTVASLQETEIVLQCDVHGPTSADNAIRISTLWRDQIGVSDFLTANAAISPLYTSDPKQIPFDNGEQQVEERWVIDLCMQAQIAITTTAQFADELVATLTVVEVAYPE